MSLVAGVMSGTSGDGVDVALVAIARAPSWRWSLRGFHHQPFRRDQQWRILHAAGGAAVSTATLARLHVDLGRWIGRAVTRACAAAGVDLADLDLVASHGQTVFHQGRVATLQLGDAATIAAITGAAVVSDFRAADIAQGGEGAPLVPWADFHLFGHPRRRRAALNLGGIANLTLLPPTRADNAWQQVVGFDTGPGNMLCDALMRRLSGGTRAFDRDGRLARKGAVNEALLAALLRHPYFRRHPPKSCGREQFGGSYLDAVLRRLPPRQRPVSAASPAAAALMATLVELTARTVAGSLRWAPGAVPEGVVAGGGAKNHALMAALRRASPDCHWRLSSECGVPGEAREALAFALLGEARLRRTPAGLPRVTGARRASVLGSLTPPPFQS